MLIWFIKNFNRFPARVQVMNAVLAIQFAFTILLVTTGAGVWFYAFLALVIVFWLARFVPWGGKDMNTILKDTVKRWDEEDGQTK